MSEVILVSEQPIAVYNEFRSQLAELESENKSLVFDYESEAGAKAARSQVYSLRKTKAAVEEARKLEKADALAYGKRVDAEAKEIKGKIEAMMDVHLKPLEEIEQREATRVANIMSAIEQIADHRTLDCVTSAMAKACLEDLQKMDITEEDFGEFFDTATDAMAAAQEHLIKQAEALETRERDEAELKVLREKVEAQEAEERARKDAELREEAARLAAEQAVKEERKRAEAEAELERERLKNVALEAEREVERMREIAREAEAEAIASVRAKAEATAKAAEARESDKKHRASVNRKALNALVKAGLEKSQAKLAIEAIAKKQVANVVINY